MLGPGQPLWPGPVALLISSPISYCYFLDHAGHNPPQAFAPAFSPNVEYRSPRPFTQLTPSPTLI